MAGTIWTKFFWSDWETDQALRLCSLAAQGLWMRMLCVAAGHDPIGYVAVAGRGLTETDLARLTGASESEVVSLLGELDRNGVFSRDRHGRIYSRRMTRDARKAAIARKNGKLGGNPTLSDQTPIPASDNRQDKPPDNTQEPRASFHSKEPIAQQQEATMPRHLFDKLLEAAGIVGNPHPGLISLAPILGLLDGGYAESDILDAIRSRQAPNARSWAYYVPIVEDYVATRRGVASKATPPQPVKAETWAPIVANWRSTGDWNYALGPPPGTPGCRVPAELLERAA